MNKIIRQNFAYAISFFKRYNISERKTSLQAQDWERTSKSSYL